MGAEAASRPLVGRSIEVILQRQSSSGAFIAAHDFDTYAYCWLRDGAFIAAALDAHGRHENAAAFHRWVARTVERHAHKVTLLEAETDVALAGTGDTLLPLDDRYTLHTRFADDGEEARDAWGNFQLDGYGFWLAALARHLTTTGTAAEPFVTAVDLVYRYLVLTWQLPCFDCWEEYPTRRHSTTWAAVAKGLREATPLAGDVASATAETITRRLLDGTGSRRVLTKFVREDHGAPTQPVAAHDLLTPGAAVAGHERVGRRLDPRAVDGSALLVLGDFGPFDPDSDTVKRTLAAVEAALVIDGGVHRYLEDEYYGGGLWIVLGGALAVVLAERDRRRAADVLDWIEAQADATGHLPEQVATHLRKPEAYAAWVGRWGRPAQPLLWSHAMYLLGVAALDAVA